MSRMGKQILSIVTVLVWQSNTIPNSCIVFLPMIRSNLGASPWYSTISGVKCTFLLLEKSKNVRSTTPTLLVVKAPLEVVHFRWPPSFLLMVMFGRDPFFMKIRSSLNPVSNKTRKNLVFIVGRFLEDLLTDFVMRTVFLYCVLPVSLSFVGFEFTCITATTAVTLPVLLISCCQY